MRDITALRTHRQALGGKFSLHVASRHAAVAPLVL